MSSIHIQKEHRGILWRDIQGIYRRLCNTRQNLDTARLINFLKECPGVFGSTLTQYNLENYLIELKGIKNGLTYPQFIKALDWISQKKYSSFTLRRIKSEKSSRIVSFILVLTVIILGPLFC